MAPQPSEGETEAHCGRVACLSLFSADLLGRSWAAACETVAILYRAPIQGTPFTEDSVSPHQGREHAGQPSWFAWN